MVRAMCGVKFVERTKRPTRSESDERGGCLSGVIEIDRHNQSS